MPTTHQVTYGNVYNQLLEYIVSADLVFYLLMVVAVIILRRKKPNAERPYRTWGYPIVPIISIVLSALLTIDLAWLAPATSGIGILIVLTGVPAYFLWQASHYSLRRSEVLMNQSRWFLRSTHRTEMLVRREIILYACKIEETTNGSRSCACSKARKAFEVVA